MMEKKLSQTAIGLSTLLLILVAILGGFLNREELSAWFYFMRFQWAHTDYLKCSNLLQVLRFSREVNLNSALQKFYPSSKYKLRRSVFLLGGYAVTELLEIGGSDLHIILFKKEQNQNFQKIYHCKKNMG